MLTRRRFIGTTVVAGATLATGAQQARPQPASKRTIVDAQVHFWKANSLDWPWDPGVTPQLPEPFTIERALPMMDEAGVARAALEMLRPIIFRGRVARARDLIDPSTTDLVKWVFALQASNLVVGRV